jgi:hypothetical protein
MMKYIYIFLMLVLGLPYVGSAQTFRDMYLDTPDSVMPLLTKLDRSDFIEYLKAGMRAKVTNRLDGVSVLKELTANYLYLQTTSSSSMQMKMLPFKGDSIMCVVNTVKAEVEDSRIAFFGRSWNRLSDGDFFKAPSIKDFFADKDSASSYMDKCDMYLVALRLNAADDSMIAEYTMPAYMGREDSLVVAPFLRKLVYRWNGERFVIE